MTTFRRALSTMLFLATMIAPTALAELVDLSVTKSGPATATAGSNVAYTVTVHNAGPDATVDVATLTDNIPDGMTFVSGVQNSGPVFSCEMPPPGSGGTISCTTGPFAAGATATFTFTFNIDVDTPNGTDFTNVARISLPPRMINNDTVIVDTNEENDTAFATTSTPPTPAADLAITKSGPSVINAGNNITYTLTVRNNGPATASNVTVTDTLPGTLTFVSLAQSGTTFNCTTPAVGAGGTITCTTATFTAGATATLTLVAQVPAGTPSGTTYDNTATIDASTDLNSVDPNEENNSGSISTIVSAVNLSVTKTGPGSVTAGSNVSYTIVVRNNGPDIALSVVLTDVLPAGTTFVSLGQTGFAASCATPAVGANGTVQCSYEYLGNGASTTFTLVINSGGAASINNTATVVTQDSFETDSSNNTATASTGVTPVSDVAITKTGPSTAARGGNAAFTIAVTNNGPSAATSVTLSDTLPAGTTFVSIAQSSGPVFNCTTPAVGAGGTVTCTIASLAAAATANFTLTVNVGNSAGNSISNTATVSSPTSDPTPANNSATAVIGTVTTVDLAVTKSGPASAVAGTNVTYTIGLVNNGTISASNVSLSDVLPADLTFVSLTQNSGPAMSCTTPAVGANGTITCTTPSLAVGTPVSFTLVARLRAAATGTVGNTATASTTSIDPFPANNTASASSTITTSADLGVTKSGPASVTAGTNATYTVTVVNNGPSDAVSVTLTDVLPANTTFVSATQTSGPTFTCTTPAAGASGTISCSIASFPNTSTAVFSFVLRSGAGATGNVANTATVSATTPDPNNANNSNTATPPITASGDLAIAKSGPPSVAAGQNVSYTITATNNGPSDATSVTLTDAMPANTTFVSFAQTAGPTFNCTTPAAGANGTITCTIASFAGAASATFTLVIGTSPIATGNIVNTATISSPTADPLPANNSATSTVTTTPGTTDLSIVKTSNVISQTAIVSTNVTYTIRVTNNGPGIGTATTVTDTLPAGTTFVSATPSQGSCTGTTTVVCTLGDLASGASATITLTVTLPATAGPVSNTATVSAVNVDSNPANNSSTVTFNAFRAQDIPTLSPLALALLAAAMAAVVLSLNRLN